MKCKNKSIVILFSGLYEPCVKQIIKTKQYCGPTIVTGFKFLLFFLGGVTIVTQLFPEMRVNKNDTVFIECQVSYDIFRVDLVLVWKFNGRIIDFTQDFFYEKVPIYS